MNKPPITVLTSFNDYTIKAELLSNLVSIHVTIVTNFMLWVVTQQKSAGNTV